MEGDGDWEMGAKRGEQREESTERGSKGGKRGATENAMTVITSVSDGPPSASYSVYTLLSLSNPSDTTKLMSHADRLSVL